MVPWGRAKARPLLFSNVFRREAGARMSPRSRGRIQQQPRWATGGLLAYTVINMPSLLKVLVKAALLGVAGGLLFFTLGLPANLRASLTIWVIFAVVMWGGFHALIPWYSAHSEPDRSPFRSALATLGKVLFFYCALLGISVGLVRIATGLDLLAERQLAIITFLIGFSITAFMMGLHTTAEFVEAERSRALIEIENARKSSELEAARRIQLSLLPAAAPTLPGLSIAFSMRTATEVGGDYYDFKSEPGAMLVAFGDATGHGLEAGLMVTVVKVLIQTLTLLLPLPGALLRISEGIRALGVKNMNMALTLARIDGMRLHIASGGMPPAQVFRAASGTVEEVQLKAPPLGQLSNFPYTEVEIELLQGDRLLFCSDGFPECMDPQSRMLGYGEIANHFKAVARFGPEEIVEGLFKVAESWAAGRPFEDDVSFLVIAAE